MIQNLIRIKFFLISYLKQKNSKSIIYNNFRFRDLNKETIEKVDQVEIDEQIAAVIPKVAENLTELR